MTPRHRVRGHHLCTYIEFTPWVAWPAFRIQTRMFNTRILCTRRGWRGGCVRPVNGQWCMDGTTPPYVYIVRMVKILNEKREMKNEKLKKKNHN